MKILFLLNSDYGVQGNIGNRVPPTVRVLKNKNIDYLVFCRGFNKDFKTDNLRIVIPFGSIFMKCLTGIQVYIWNKFPLRQVKNFFYETFLIFHLSRINLLDFDIVHSWDFTPKVYSYIKKKNPNIKIIQDMTNPFPNVLREINDLDELFPGIDFNLPKDITSCFNFIDEYIVPSQFTIDSLVNEKIKRKNINLVEYGVDSKKFVPLKNKNNKIFRVAFAGNINRRKGIKYLIGAWKELGLKNAELNMYGRVYPEINQYLKDLKKFNIKVHGFVDLSKVLPKNDIFLFPSLFETSGKVLNEALASGLPVITTYNSGPTFKDGSEGFIIPIQNTKSIKDKILDFYLDRNKVKKMSKNARAFAVKRSWDEYGLQVYNIYLNILK